MVSLVQGTAWFWRVLFGLCSKDSFIQMLGIRQPETICKNSDFFKKKYGPESVGSMTFLLNNYLLAQVISPFRVVYCVRWIET